MNTRDEIRQVVVDSILAFAPEADFDALDPGRPFRDELDIDSFDFLNLIVALHEKLGVDIPEADYGKVLTLDAMLDYLEARLGAR
ncbi:phosphopantetheine-binding protein [Burkholderiaceae bacterium FT117]|uniref:acyl carrier protein n=1 Tax=Zeimonas sediminis TaxID=2944268 RepID=UPI002342DD47|nr:phosphopantetheine-binding protein [Zeimonas sediminis]MCM5571278.1 phosphopantetheine-binding protein [Zeimonas sediminis]